MLVVHCRSWLVRHRRLVWLAAALAAAGAAWGVADAVTSLERAERRWGEAVTVWVSTRDLVPGDTIEAAPRAHPRAMVPSSALGRDPTGLIALQHVAADEVVTAADVGRSGLELLPAGWRGVAVSTDSPAITVVPGQRVEVVGAGQVLAADAVVIGTADAIVTVGVPRDVAALVADAAVRGEASLVLRPD